MLDVTADKPQDIPLYLPFLLFWIKIILYYSLPKYI